MKLLIVCVFFHAFLPYAGSRMVVGGPDSTEANATTLNHHNNPYLRTRPFEIKTANSAASGAQWANRHTSKRRYLQGDDDSPDTEDANSTNSDSADETIEMNSTDLVMEIEMNISSCTTAFMIVETDSTGCESTGALDNLTITGCERAFVKIVLNATGCENAYATIETHGNDTDSADDSLDDDS